MKTILSQEIEEYALDWHYDEESKEYAIELGTFLFAFISHLKDSKLSKRTEKNHIENTYIIGEFEARYGFRDNIFSYEDLAEGPQYEFEFDRKISDSETALKSYESTWRKLGKFIKSGTFQKYVAIIEEQLNKEKHTVSK
jgi:hypothetical protein